MSKLPTTHDAAPILTWPGKGEHAPSGTLRTRTIAHFRADPGHANPPALLIRADARDAVRRLLESHAGSIDLIYLDPPFFVGSDFEASLRTPGQSGRLFAYSDRWRSPAEYLSLLHDVLSACRRLLADDGSIYVHVDQRTSHWIRCILHEIFGPEHDRGVIAWLLGNGVKTREQWGCAHNDILCFSKGDRFKFRADRPALREPFAEGSLRSHFRNVDAQGRRFRVRRINGREYRYFADEGRVVGSVWADCPAMSARSPILDQSTGYPTQKPERLLERILEASSDPGDLVLDLFCGSGTMPAVAQRLARRWIAADSGRLAIETTLARVLDPESTCGVEVMEITAEHSAAPQALLASMGARELESCPDQAVRGRLGDRPVLAFPPGIEPDEAHVNEAARLAGPGLPAWIFTSADSGPVSPAREARANPGVQCWRYRPECAAASSLRSVVFASEFHIDAELAPDGRLAWSIAGHRLRLTTGPGPLVRPIEPDSVASWSLRDSGSGTLFAAGRGTPPDSIDLRRCARPMLLRLVDAYGFVGECPVRIARPTPGVVTRTEPARSRT